MTVLKPFRGVRPIAEYAAQVASVPYDVIDTRETKAIVNANPLSFLRISRSEAEFDDGFDPYADAVYGRAKENLLGYMKRGILIQDEEPSLYVYQLHRNGFAQTGIVGCSAVDDYENGLIKVHEKTKPEKEIDRTRHILETRSHSEPVLFAYRNLPQVTSLIEAETLAPPLYDFVADDGVRHVFWKARESAALAKAFAAVPCTYIADGHHRAASSVNCRKQLRAANPRHTGDEGYNYFLTVIFPHDQLHILAYNRIIRRLTLSPDEALARLEEVYEVRKTDRASPAQKRHVCMYLAGQWYVLSPKNGERQPEDPVDALDVSVLQHKALTPIFGIGDPRTDKNIDFVGGIRGTAELERLVDNGQAQAAFSLFPVSTDELLTIADAGRTMAPKSTWFEPKLRSGLIIHLFGEENR